MPRKPLARTGLPAYSTIIRRMLRERDWTHAQFAARVGISKNSAYAALNGGDVKVSTLMRMASTLGVPVATLLADPTPKPVQAEPQANLNPMLAALLANMMGQPHTPETPQTAVDFLALWKSLNSRDMAALLSLAKSLASNREVEASYTERRMAMEK